MATNWLNNNPDVQIIIMAAAWSGYVPTLYKNLDNMNRSSTIGQELMEKGMRALLDKLDIKSRKVLLLGDIPRPGKTLNYCAASEWTMLVRQSCARYLNSQAIFKWHRPSDNTLIKIAHSYPNVDVILPTSKLCNEHQCPTYIEDEFLYMDSNHMRRDLKQDNVLKLANILGLDTYFSNINSVSILGSDRLSQ